MRKKGKDFLNSSLSLSLLTIKNQKFIKIPKKEVSYEGKRCFYRVGLSFAGM